MHKSDVTATSWAAHYFFELPPYFFPLLRQVQELCKGCNEDAEIVWPDVIVLQRISVTSWQEGIAWSVPNDRTVLSSQPKQKLNLWSRWTPPPLLFYPPGGIGIAEPLSPLKVTYEPAYVDLLPSGSQPR